MSPEEIIHNHFSELLSKIELGIVDLSASENWSISPDITGFNGVARQTIERLLAKTNVDTETVLLSKLESGKPVVISNNRKIGVSITHSKKYMVCGINILGDIGLDIESTDRRIHPGLADRIYHPDENLAESCSPIQLWTIKEAVLKLTGTGLRTNMKSVKVERLSGDDFYTRHKNMDIRILSKHVLNHWLSIAYN